MVYGLGERLRECRQKAHLSQKQVSKMIGVSTATISRYEHGEATPTLESLIKLAAVYKVSTDYLLMGKECSSTEVSVEGAEVANCS